MRTVHYTIIVSALITFFHTHIVVADAPVAVSSSKEEAPAKAKLPQQLKHEDSHNNNSAGTHSISLQTAKGEKLAVASGHYARARALLIASVREFDQGLDLVDPSALVDTQKWRKSVLDRAEELARVLDPQPRSSRSGIRFDDSTAGIGDAGALKKQ